MIKDRNFDNMEGTAKYLESVPFDVTRKTLYSAGDLY